MKKGGLKLQPEKCQFFQDKIHYLGHEVSAEGIRPLPDYIEVVQTWPMPRTRTAIRAFLGKVGYYRRFIPGYAGLAGPLYNATTYPDDQDDKSKKKLDKLELEVTPQMEEAFKKLKEHLLKAPILAYPDFKSEEPFILDTDWSLDNNAVGAVLSQKQNGKERVIAYGAKKLSPAQASYPSTKGELAAVIIFINKWSYYLRHRPFILRTDNAALKWIHSMEAPTGMIQRWLDVLANHKFEVQHRAGVKHGNADALSRAPHLEHQGDTDVSAGECAHLWAVTLDELADTDAQVGSLDELVEDSVEQDNLWTAEYIADRLSEDDELAMIARHLRQGTKLTTEEVGALSRHGRVWAELMGQMQIDPQGVVRYYDRKGRKAIILPPCLWTEAIKKSHQDVAHMGASATVEYASKYFYFPGMFKLANEVVQRCEACQKRDNKPGDQRHTLHSHRDGYPFQKLSIDFVGPLPKSTKGNEFLFTIRCTFTRWLEAFPIKQATAETVVRILTTEVFPRFGVCEQLHSDRGSQFTSNLFQEAAQMLGIRLTTTPAYNPKSNPVERAHRDLGRALKALVNGNPRSWEEHLPQVLFVMRTATCRSTGLAPYKMLFGRDATMPLDLVFGPPPFTASEYKSDFDYVEALRNRIESAHAWARKNMGLTINRQRKAYFKEKPNPFLPGEQVWLFTPTNPRGQRTKFNTHWTGPWTVKKKVNPLCYELYPDARWNYFRQSVVVSVDRLKKFHVKECPTDDYMLPPGPNDSVFMEGDEYAEAVQNHEYEEHAEVAQPGQEQPAAGHGQLQEPGGGEQPAQDAPVVGEAAVADNEAEDSEEEDEPIEVREPAVPRGPRLDAERERLRQEQHELHIQREAARVARELRAVEREAARLRQLEHPAAPRGVARGRGQPRWRE
jgi:transposase InsO family protein